MIRKFGMLGLVAGIGVAAAGSAAGGPVRWEYRSEVGAEEPSPTYPGAIVTGATANSILLSDLVGAGPRPEWGWQTVRVAELRPSVDTTPDAWQHFPGASFWLTVTIRDWGSGQAGALTFRGQGDETHRISDDYPFTVSDRRALVSRLSPPGEQVLTLGGNDYRVRLFAEADPSGSALVAAAVTVGEVNATPEPASLALAALGLASLAGLRTRGK